MTRHIEAWVQGRWVAQAPSVTADEAEAWGWKWRYVGGRSYEVRCPCGSRSTAGLGEEGIVCICGRRHVTEFPPPKDPRFTFADMADELRRRTAAPQRPADASVAPESPESRAALVSTLRLAQQRANALADDCGTLRTENDILLRENAKLRREVERLGRKKR